MVNALCNALFAFWFAVLIVACLLFMLVVIVYMIAGAIVVCGWIYEQWWARKYTRESRHNLDCSSKDCEMNAVKLANQFHKHYEALAPSFGYETRTETRIFQQDSSNGQLMIAVCKRILNDYRNFNSKAGL